MSLWNTLQKCLEAISLPFVCRGKRRLLGHFLYEDQIIKATGMPKQGAFLPRMGSTDLSVLHEGGMDEENIWNIARCVEDRRNSGRPSPIRIGARARFKPADLSNSMALKHERSRPCFPWGRHWDVTGFNSGSDLRSKENNKLLAKQLWEIGCRNIIRR